MPRGTCETCGQHDVFLHANPLTPGPSLSVCAASPSHRNGMTTKMKSRQNWMRTKTKVMRASRGQRQALS